MPRAEGTEHPLHSASICKRGEESLDGIRTHLGENDPRWKRSGGKRTPGASPLHYGELVIEFSKRFIASRAVLWQIMPASEKARTLLPARPLERGRPTVRTEFIFDIQLFFSSFAKYSTLRIRKREPFRTYLFEVERIMREFALSNIKSRHPLFFTMCGRLLKVH